MVNKRILILKFHKFFFHAGIATLFPHFVSTGRILKVSNTSLSLIFGTLIGLGTPLGPIIGAAADKYKMHRALLICSIALLLLSFFPLVFMNPPKSEFQNLTLSASSVQSSVCLGANYQPVILFYDDICSWTCKYSNKDCRKWNISAECIRIPQIPNLCNHVTLYHDITISDNDCSIDCLKEGFSLVAATDADDDSLHIGKAIVTWQFWVFVVFGVLAIVSYTVASSLTDVICLQICGDPYLFAYQEIWASLGFGLLYIISEFVKHAFYDPDGEVNYTSSYYLMVAILSWDIMIALQLEVNFPDSSDSVWRDAWRPYREPRNKVFLFYIVIAGTFYGFLYVHQIWYLQDLAYSYKIEMVQLISKYGGIIIGLQYITCAPGYLLTGWVIRKIGTAHSWSVVFFITSLRFIFYSIIPNPSWVILVQLLHVVYCLCYITTICIAYSITHPGAESTSMFIIHSAQRSVGAGLGLIIGGPAYSMIEKEWAYFDFGALLFIIGLLSLLLNKILTFLENNRAFEENEEGEGI